MKLSCSLQPVIQSHVGSTILEMPMRLAILLSALFVLSAPAKAAELSSPSCKFGSLEYGEGATMCECPSLKAEAGFATGGPPGTVTSRRLICKKGAWTESGSNCVELTGASQYMTDEHRKLDQLYCPRLGTIEEMSSALAKATPAQGVLVLSSVCRRFGVPPAACAAAIEAIVASQKQ